MIKGRAAALGSVGSRHRSNEIRPEQLEVDDGVQPLEVVALGRELLQPLVDIEEPGLTPHPTLPSAITDRQSRTPSKARFLEVSIWLLEQRTCTRK
jgi:hypothetical protein